MKKRANHKVRLAICVLILVLGMASTTGADSVPAPWLNQDIGTNHGGVTGGVDYNPATKMLTIEGDGEDIWGANDDFHYVYQPWLGDVELILRIVSLEQTNLWAKCGVMVREQLTDTSSHAMMILTPLGGISTYSFQWVAGASRNNSIQGGTGTIGSLPKWVRLTRVGDLFTGYYADDVGGSPGAWTNLGNQTISMSTNVYVGMCLTSHSTGNLCTAVVDNLGGDVAILDLPEIYYVDAGTPVDGDGSSWEMAFRRMQDALAVAWYGDEIRVAQGIYTPAPPGLPPPPPPLQPPTPPLPVTWINSQSVEVAPADRTATFQLKKSVTLKGGYAGFGHANPNDRNVEIYKTILSGDLNGNDADLNNPLDLLYDPCRAENSYHVVTGSKTDATAVLDGFTITAGNANGSWSDRTNRGGGMFNVSGSPTITNCTFTKNLARGGGGGMYNYDYSNPTVINCKFLRNSADDGGGGICNERYSGPTLTDCTFRANLADRDGGGIANIYHSSPTLTDCAFSGNSAGGGGGGICNWLYSGPILSNCTFSENSAGAGGGFFCEYASPPPVAGIANGRIAENPDTPVFYNSGDANIRMANCAIVGNSPGDYAGGMDDFGSHPMLTNCTFTANSAGAGGGIYSIYESPTLLNCAFSGNSASRGGGMFNFNSRPTLTNCTFSGNSADSGGGMYNTGGGLHGPSTSSLTLTNCTFAGNFAPNGTALACDAWTHWWPSNVKLTNCILWDGGDEIWNNDESTIAITYSDVESGWPGEGNIDTDPCFVDLGYWDADGVWVDGDYHLLPGSPCIDTGDPNYVTEPNETDLDGRPRIIDGRIDMGAYEYSPPIPAEARIDPRTINLASQGKWIIVLLWLPEDYNVADIDPNSLLLEYEIGPEQLWVNEEKQVVMARFSREEVQAILNVGEVKLTITGQLTNGTIFEGRDAVKVIDRGGGKSAKQCF
ncbi:MAG TPA: right-handed parallel beta-helix repeat-containing protein [Planctomycetes bacterium]|nr:right-handed parallel beta-helix repeat-containing protein [Planctomycetota bacterium]